MDCRSCSRGSGLLSNFGGKDWGLPPRTLASTGVKDAFFMERIPTGSTSGMGGGGGGGEGVPFLVAAKRRLLLTGMEKGRGGAGFSSLLSSIGSV